MSAVLAGSMVIAGLMAPAAQAAPIRGEYVALGDSAAAGPLIEPQDQNQLGCLRAQHNYPAVLASQLRLSLRDATCSSAKSVDVYRQQQRTFAGSVPVQTTLLSTHTRLVTITIGLNDIGMFPIALSCVDLPGSAPCSERYRRGGVDELRIRINREGPSWGRMLDAVKRSAPNAKVIVVGYGTYIRKNGCPAQPVTPADANYLRATVAHANQVMATQAQRRGMSFVDIAPMSEGHDMCAAPARQYFFGMVPSSFGVPLHPTALGMRAIGRYVAQQVNR